MGQGAWPRPAIGYSTATGRRYGRRHARVGFRPASKVSDSLCNSGSPAQMDTCDLMEPHTIREGGAKKLLSNHRLVSERANVQTEMRRMDPSLNCVLRQHDGQRSQRSEESCGGTSCSTAEDDVERGRDDFFGSSSPPGPHPPLGGFVRIDSYEPSEGEDWSDPELERLALRIGGTRTVDRVPYSGARRRDPEEGSTRLWSTLSSGQRTDEPEDGAGCSVSASGGSNVGGGSGCRLASCCVSTANTVPNSEPAVVRPKTRKHSRSQSTSTRLDRRHGEEEEEGEEECGRSREEASVPSYTNSSDISDGEGSTSERRSSSWETLSGLGQGEEEEELVWDPVPEEGSRSPAAVVPLPPPLEDGELPWLTFSHREADSSSSEESEDGGGHFVQPGLFFLGDDMDDEDDESSDSDEDLELEWRLLDDLSEGVSMPISYVGPQLLTYMALEERLAQAMEALANLESLAVEFDQASPPANQHLINCLPHITVEDTVEDSCPICCSEYIQGEVSTHLPCNHGFHRQCVALWLQKSGTCPVCRHVLTPPTPLPDTPHLAEATHLAAEVTPPLLFLPDPEI